MAPTRSTASAVFTTEGLTTTAPAGSRTVLVADEHELILQATRSLFAREPWVRRVLQAATAAEAEALTERYVPHVAVIDLSLAVQAGIDLCRRLSVVRPGLRVLLMSDGERISRRGARVAGAHGLVLKSQSAVEILRALRAVSAGRLWFEPGAREPIALSGRQRDVLRLAAQGETNTEIGHALHLSPHTVKQHLSLAFRSLGARNRAEAVQKAQRLGMLDWS